MPPCTRRKTLALAVHEWLTKRAGQYSAGDCFEAACDLRAWLADERGLSTTLVAGYYVYCDQGIPTVAGHTWLRALGDCIVDVGHDLDAEEWGVARLSSPVFAATSEYGRHYTTVVPRTFT